MKVLADLNKCMGYGNCVATAPNIYQLDSNGKVKVIKPTIKSPDDIALAQAAIRNCPTSALSISEDKS
ncbi:ferredoxin [Castellaniella sp. GW247-6E4]|uniref:ferredoxin n=1 Tax=Castellaniella sp. GW247-6E4 TaxID=3140380 RepID=UPI0033162BA6